MPSAGEMYLVKLHEDPKADLNKTICSREPVRRLWSGLRGDLRVLTLPGLHWKFERMLLKDRRKAGYRTFITAAERDAKIYRESRKLYMPQTKEVQLYECCWVEHLIAETDLKWTAAWLDWNGPLSPMGVEAIRMLWPRLSHSLVLTFMVARYSGEVKALCDKAGVGWAPMIAKLIGVPIDQVHETRYRSSGRGQTFAQVTAVKSKVTTPVRVCRYINGIKLEELLSGQNS